MHCKVILIINTPLMCHSPHSQSNGWLPIKISDALPNSQFEGEAFNILLLFKHDAISTDMTMSCEIFQLLNKQMRDVQVEVISCYKSAHDIMT